MWGRGRGGDGPGANLMFRHAGHWLLVNESFIPLSLSSPADTLWLRPSFAAYCLADKTRSIKSSAPLECHCSLKEKLRSLSEPCENQVADSLSEEQDYLSFFLRVRCATSADGLKLPLCI